MGFIKYWLPFFLWALLIFIASSIPAVKVSGNGLLDFIYHKTAHIVEYSIFYLLFYRASVSGEAVFSRNKILLAFLVTTIYGVSDEIHQAFTPGREPRVRDVFFDFLGGALGLAVWRFDVTTRRRRST